MQRSESKGKFYDRIPKKQKTDKNSLAIRPSSSTKKTKQTWEALAANGKQGKYFCQVKENNACENGRYVV